jgi:tetratricopeptide (TPR) repeat protein
MLRAMYWTWRRRACALIAAAAAFAEPLTARADNVETPNTDGAREHFETARSLYSRGSYRDAIRELEAAHDLDPAAKDLVYNLGVVNEKLADIDRALYWFNIYETLKLTTLERERANSIVRRLEGAKHEVLAIPSGPPHAAPPATRAIATIRPSPKPNSPAVGRVDSLTIAAAGLSVTGLTIGTIMGVQALDDRVVPGFVTRPTSRGGPTYSDAEAQASTAHTEATIADIAFGVAVVSAVAATSLFFARPPENRSRATIVTMLSAGPTAGGGTVSLHGVF